MCGEERVNVELLSQTLFLDGLFGGFMRQNAGEIERIFAGILVTKQMTRLMKESKDNIQVTHIGIKYNPPSIIVEYLKKTNEETKRFHRKLNFSQRFYDSTESLSLNNLCTRLSTSFDLLHENQIPLSQLKRVLKKLWSRKRIHTNKKDEQNYHDLDLNLVSDQELKKAKDQMDKVFYANKINSDTEGYMYDKKVDFNEDQSDSSWD